MTEESPTPEEVATQYLASVEWRRDRSTAPRPRFGALTIWENWIDQDPERAWLVVLKLVRLRPSDDEVLELVWYRVRYLLQRHGYAFRDRVSQLVTGNARLRRIVPPAELDPANLRPKPLDVPALVTAYLTNAEHHTSAHELDTMIQENPAGALPLALEIISRGPLYNFTSYNTFSPLHKLLQDHGAAVIEDVETAASQSVLVRRCLWRMARGQSHPPDDYDILPEIWTRVEQATAGTMDHNTDDAPGMAHTLSWDHERIVTAWFAYEDSFWAWDRVRDVVENDPELGWRVITLLVQEAPHSSLERIGAGPLEDLLEMHGRHFIDRVEICARDDGRFRAALAVVWQTEMSDELWARVRSALGKSSD